MSSMVRGAGLGLALLMGISTGAVRAQPPGGFGGRQRGSRGDPSQLFDMMAQGKDVISRDQVDPRFQMLFDRFAKRMGITDGKMTRQQFTEYMQQRQAKRGSKRSSSGGPSGQDAWVENLFRRYDRRNNGQLTPDEVPDEMKVEYKRWDTNGDGFIDLNEFKAYAQARMQQLQAERGPRGGQPAVPPPAASAAKPPAPEELPSNFYRRSKLPKEVPAWFTQLDTDEDGQIGVYEWRKSGRPFSEFLAMDRNSDGFVTIEEVVRYVRANAPKDSGTAAEEKRWDADLRYADPKTRMKRIRQKSG